MASPLELADVGDDALAAADWDAARSAFERALEIEPSARAFEGLSWAAWWLNDAAALFTAREQAFRLYHQSGDRIGAARMATWIASDGFLRTYGFLSSILEYTNAEWEKLSIFLNFLVSKLPAPEEEDLSKGILEAIDMDSYRAEKQAAHAIQLADEDGEIGPVPTGGGGGRPEAEIDRLSNIIAAFNEMFGNIPWDDKDRIYKLVTEEIPARVEADKAYQNAKLNSDRQNARIEHDKALGRVMVSLMSDHTELFKQFMDNDSFKRWMTETVFGLTYAEA